MPEVTSQFFLTLGAEGWTATAGGASGLTQALSGVSLSGKRVGKNLSDGTPYWEWTGTFNELPDSTGEKPLSIPAGATITGINLDYDWRCSLYSTGASSTVGPAELRDEAGSLLKTFSTSQAFSSTTTLATRTGTKQTGLSLPVASKIKLRIGQKPNSGNNNKAEVEALIRTFVVTITYEESGPKTVERSASLGAAALIATTAQRTLLRVAAFAATAVIAVAGTFWTTEQRSASLAATGSIASGGTAFSVFDRSAALSATGAVQSAGESETPPATHEASVSLGAAGSVATVGQRGLLRSAAIGASGAVASAPQRILQRSASASASGGISTSAIRDLIRAASFGAAGGVASQGLRDLMRSVGLSATGDVVVAGGVEGGMLTLERSASLGAAGEIASAGEFWSILERSASVQSSGAISADGLGEVARSAGLQGVVLVTADGQAVLDRSASLSATALVSGAGALSADELLAYLTLSTFAISTALASQSLDVAVADGSAVATLTTTRPTTYTTLTDGSP